MASAAKYMFMCSVGPSSLLTLKCEFPEIESVGQRIKLLLIFSSLNIIFISD